MGDDLSAFFAKKKDKKKKSAVKIEEVGNVLERKARRQEDFDNQLSESKNNVEEDKKGPVSEESEWIEYGDSNQGRLEGLRLKDMGVESEVAEVENQESEEGKEIHETKTWGQVDEKKKKAAEEPEHAVTITDKQFATAYKPPAMRSTRYVPPQHKAAANFDVSNDAFFPSLADASKIEKNKKEEAKNGNAGGWVKAGATSETRTLSQMGSAPASGPRSYASTGRESALAAAKAFTASTTTPAPPPVSIAREPVAAAADPEKGRYVPPHMRRT